MKSLIPSLMVGVLTLLGVWFIQNPPEVPATFAAAPSANTLLVIFGLIAALPLLKRYGKAYLTLWVEETRGLVSTGKGLVAVVGQRVGGGWKQAVGLLVLGVVIGLFFGGGVKWPTIPSLPEIFKPTPTVPVAPEKPSSVTYVYEKDDGGIPSGVLAGLSKLNTQGILASPFEEDTTDGSGETPEQYQLAKTEAVKAGLPALVVQSGDKVIRVVKAATTEQHVLEAIAP